MADIKKPLGKITSKVKNTGFKPEVKRKTVTNRTVKINRTIAQKRQEKKDSRSRKKAEYLAQMPKSRFKRFLFKLHPKRVLKYWFSRDGLFMALKITGVGIVVMFILLFGVFAYYRKDLPKTTSELNACSKGETTQYYDRTGTVLLWSSKGDVECVPVEQEAISDFLKHATIAMEDKDFYKHGGFSFSGFLRAAINNYRGQSTQGGSTITQQYVKNAILRDDERTINRKIKELILSVELSRNFSKDEILNAYLNEILFGSVYNGAESASRGYFDKSAKDLTIEESALLVAAIPAPNYYWSNPEDHLIRKDYVIDRMLEQGYITQEQSDAAKAVDVMSKLVVDNNKYKNILHPYFVLSAQEELINEYGDNVSKLGYKVITTLDLNLQKAAEDSVANGMKAVDAAGFDNAALVSIDVQTGQVVAMVGGRDFTNTQYGNVNFATTPRSPGSTFKPYDYAALMASSPNWGAGSIFYDMDTDFGGGYGARKNGIGFDYDGREPGGITMRYALGGSRNTPAIKAMYAAGIKTTHELTEKLGVVSGINGCGDGFGGTIDCSEVLSTGIGDGGQIRLDEHVNAYATFSRLGSYKKKTQILKIEDSKGKVIQEFNDEGTQVLDPQIAYIINDMLADRNASYFRVEKAYRERVTAGFEALNVPAAMKTGTTNNFDNGWLLGSTTRYATGVWIGHHENKSSIVKGFENITGPIWGAYMKTAHTGLETAGWTQPEGIKKVALAKDFYPVVKAGCTAALLGNICGYSDTDIYPSWYVAKTTGDRKEAIIDTVTGKLATDCTPENTKKKIVSGSIVPEIPSTDSGYSRWVAAINRRYGGSAGSAIPTEKDDLHNCSDIKPTVTLSITNNGNSYILNANSVQGTHALKSLTFKADGEVIPGGIIEISSAGLISFTYTPSASGSSNISVEVNDVAMYVGSDSRTVSVSGGSSLNITPPLQSGTSVTFNWTSENSFDQYELCFTKSGSSTNCIKAPGNKTNYVTDVATLGGAGSYKVVVSGLNAGKNAGSSSPASFTLQ